MHCSHYHDEVLTKAMKQTLSAHAPQQPRKLKMLNRIPTATKMNGRSPTTIGDDGTPGLSRSSASSRHSGLSRSSRLLM